MTLREFSEGREGSLVVWAYGPTYPFGRLVYMHEIQPAWLDLAGEVVPRHGRTIGLWHWRQPTAWDVAARDQQGLRVHRLECCVVNGTY